MKLDFTTFVVILCLISLEIYIISIKLQIEHQNLTILFVNSCNCNIEWKKLLQLKLLKHFNETICSKSATLRGKGQKIISFSFYGNLTHKRGYFKGIDNNAIRLPKIYPGWIMRVYYNIQDKYDYISLCKLQCKYKDIMDICYVGDLPGYGNMIGSEGRNWRFLPLLDPFVDIMLSRDIDSFISEREAAAVNEWLRNYSNVLVHNMRDHPYGHRADMLAGMWGANIKLNRELWKNITAVILEGSKQKNGEDFVTDQSFLNSYIFPLAYNTPNFILQHDSYTCINKEYEAGITVGFPTQRIITQGYNFIGSRFEVDTQPLIHECPIECRRNKTWKYC